MAVTEKLSPGLRAALRDLARGSEYAPERVRRPTFHRLIDVGLARWCGYGLGGESFIITDAGREYLAQSEK